MNLLLYYVLPLEIPELSVCSVANYSCLSGMSYALPAVTLPLEDAHTAEMS